MEINAKLISKIEGMEKLGAKPEQIKELLELNKLPEEIKQEYTAMQQVYSVKEAAKVMQDVLKGPTGRALKNDRAYELKLLRLIKDGEIEAIKGSSSRESFTIQKDEVKRFMEESKMTKENWRELAKKHEKTIATKDKRIAELEKEIEELKAAAEQPAPKKTETKTTKAKTARKSKAKKEEEQTEETAAE